MRRREFLRLFPAIPATAGASPSVDLRHGDLRVSPDRRFLAHADGTPFFYLGDTAWELFHRTTREEAEMYLEDRRRKGFTVIQAVVLAELDGLDTPNSYGHLPLHNNDPARPNQAYFEYVDDVVRNAARKGLYIGMLPTWGNKVVKGSWEKSAPVIFNAANAQPYGRFLGRRYKEAANIIWILGGDRNPEGVEDVWRAMAAGLKQGDGGRHLLTFHPNGGNSSAKALHNEPWLDFNMIQSGHHLRDNPNYEMIGRDYGRSPVKPCMDGEPRYENHPVNWEPDRYGWFDQHDVRQAAYWSLFAGAHGHTYGCHDIWQMVTPDRKPVGLARGNWKNSIHLPGSEQMGHVRRLMLSRPCLGRIPDQSLIDGEAGSGADHVQATRGESYAFLYLPAGKPVTVRMGLIQGAKVRASWFDPRRGQSRVIGEFANQGSREFAPPGTPGRGNDWVLILDKG